MSAEALTIARSALASKPAWLVGGAVRDQLMGRALADIDVVVDGDPADAARAIASQAKHAGVGAACFALSESFGAWRVVAHDRSWQIDVEALRGASLEKDLALRDFTVNAIAQPLEGGALHDPLDGCVDLQESRLRLAGPTAFADDPLRVLRLVRVAVELGLQADAEALAAARVSATRLAAVAPERVFIELRRILACERPSAGLELMGSVGATAVVLPELSAMQGVEQSHFHHLDVYGHTLEVLDHAVELSRPGGWSSARVGAALGERHAGAAGALLAKPLADEMTRGEALRWGALLHDVAKPATRAVRPFDRRVTFMGHDIKGAELARGVLERLRASVRTREHIAGLVRHHLRLGFLVHERQPLARELVFEYLRASEPVEVDVTLLSVCDRLATRGAKADRAIAAHLELGRAMLGDALDWHEHGAPTPLLRGDELSRLLGLAPGPRIGELLERLRRAQYSGLVGDREQALAFVRSRH